SLRVPVITTLPDGNPVLILVRPEELTLHAEQNGHTPSSALPDNRIPGIIELRTFLGPFTRFHVRINEQTILTADIPSQQARNFAVAQSVLASFPATACQILPLTGQSVIQDQPESELSPS
ncbi:MAG TPA: TOBE domain-containing protein, partial [Ktedonobacteraceae bacterium]|nr:TOBE domain-containing protein [Ktedonobacteraceae bacterium]